jgi:hypothetical protein
MSSEPLTTPAAATEKGLLIAVLLLVVLGTAGMLLIS